MSRRKFELVSSADVDVLPEFDWNHCVICQTEKREKLLCPNNSKQHDKHVGYKSLAEDLLNKDRDIGRGAGGPWPPQKFSVVASFFI